jgi:branched-chain amino acid aminotransferase
MPTTIGILTPGGLTDAGYTADTLAEAARYEPEGIYTLASTFKRDHALLLDAHLNRLEESARLEGIALQLDRPALRKALRHLVDRSGYENSRFRLTVPRANPSHLIIALEPFAGVPPAIKQNGVKVVTIKIRRRNPRAKTNDWIQQREVAAAQIPEDAYQGIIVNEAGQLLEGFSSNFYAIRDGFLYTAGDALVLSGISRKIALQVIPDIVPLQMTPITRAEIARLAEAFLTSSSRGVIPIVQIDKHVIGSGKPGPLTQAISRQYNAWVEAHLEPI